MLTYTNSTRDIKLFSVPAEVKPDALLTYDTRGGEWSASRSGYFTSGQRALELDRRPGGLQIRSEHGSKKKNSCPCRESNPYSPIGGHHIIDCTALAHPT